MIRIASGSGIALGINMRNVDDQIGMASKEARCRLWCSVFMLEHLLTTMTGRPSCLVNSFSTNAPLPVGESQYHDFWTFQLHGDPLLRQKLVNWTLYQHEGGGLQPQLLRLITPNASLYYFYMVDLSLIAQAITSHLYGAHAFEGGWARVENQMNFYGKKLDIWLSTVNDKFSFTPEDGRLSKEQVSLALNYHSVRIMLSRPCLSRPNIHQQSGIRFPRSRFGNDTALTCVDSALSVLAVLPEEPDTHWIYTNSPWWAMLHFLMQATVVLLIQMAVGSVPTKTQRDGEEHGKGGHSTAETLDAIVPLACQKALRWLQNMAMTNIASQRGFGICNGLFSRITLAKRFKSEDVPYSTPLLSRHPDGLHGSVPFPPAGIHSQTQSAHLSREAFCLDHDTEQLLSTLKRPQPGTPYDGDASISTFQSDIGQENVEEALFPYNVTLESDIAWFLSSVESEMSRPGNI